MEPLIAFFQGQGFREAPDGNYLPKSYFVYNNCLQVNFESKFWFQGDELTGIEEES